jgi:hypothetical protein
MTIVSWLEAGQKLNRFPEPAPTKEWGEHLLSAIEHGLSWGELAAIGVDIWTGDLAQITAETWRLQIAESDHPYNRGVSQFALAFRGEPILTSRYFGTQVRTAVSTHALATWAGAEVVPDAPTITVRPQRSKATTSPPEPAARNRGGRPPKYDWDAFWVEIVRRANTPDGLPEDRRELQRGMLDWCAETWGDAPEESEIRKRIGMLYPLKTPGG